MFRPDELPGVLDRLKSVCQEGFLLSTCNRTEAYALVGHEQSGVDRLRQFLADERSIARDVFIENSYSHSRDEAIRHFFRVASGLDSMALGESEILGQIRLALDEARNAGAINSLLGRLGAAGLRAGRDVRATTMVGRNRVSLVSLACGEAANRGVSFDGARVAVLGAGQTAESVVRYLHSTSSAKVVVTSRSFERARSLANLYSSECCPWDQRHSLISECDVVFACTSAREPILSPEELRPRVTRKLLCVDLGVPRDIDPGVRGLTNVTLIDLAQLEIVATENRARRGSEVKEAEIVIDRSVDRFVEWWRSRQVVPTIMGLRALAESIRDDELERALRRLGSLEPGQVQQIRSMAHRIVGKLLHRPLTMLRHDAEDGNMAQVLHYLFQLDGAPAPGTGPLGIPCAHAEQPSPEENRPIVHQS